LKAKPTIGPERPDQPDVLRLLAARDAYSASLYPPESNHALDLAGLLDPGVTFLVARENGVAVGCGAVVRQAAGEGEVKSMWVEPHHRGAGLGRALLAAVEATAHELGIRTLLLKPASTRPRRWNFIAAPGTARSARSATTSPTRSRFSGRSD
jgi:putative acetyltransferase